MNSPEDIVLAFLQMELRAAKKDYKSGRAVEISEVINSLKGNNLRQQANALNEYAYSDKPLTRRGLNVKAISLGEKAEALKE